MAKSGISPSNAQKKKIEIDKEIMFRKIMPSLKAISAAETETASPRHPPLPVGSPVIAPTSAAPTVAPTAPTVAPVAPVAAPVAPVAAPVPLMVNLVEFLVMQRLDEAMGKFRCCPCDRCRNDVAALSLNKLQPHYIVATADRIPDLAALFNGPEITAAIVQGVLRVKSHPRH